MDITEGSIKTSSTTKHRTQRTRKDTPFERSAEFEQVYERLHELLISSPVLAYPYWKRAFHLYIDASGFDLCVALMQKEDKTN